MSCNYWYRTMTTAAETNFFKKLCKCSSGRDCCVAWSYPCFFFSLCQIQDGELQRIAQGIKDPALKAELCQALATQDLGFGDGPGTSILQRCASCRMSNDRDGVFAQARGTFALATVEFKIHKPILQGQLRVSTKLLLLGKCPTRWDQHILDAVRS